MIYAEEGKEQERFIDFAENALGILARERYSDFLAVFDSSRLTEQDLCLALRYLDETRPTVKIDDPVLLKNRLQRIDFLAYTDGRGYCMDYDLTTDGEPNDLTVQIEFLKNDNGYFVELDDLHTL